MLEIRGGLEGLDGTYSDLKGPQNTGPIGLAQWRRKKGKKEGRKEGVKIELAGNNILSLAGREEDEEDEEDDRGEWCDK